MATVPVYTRQVQQAPERPAYQNAQAPRPGADAFGAAIGEGLGQVGQAAAHAGAVINKVQEEETEKANAARVMGAYSQLGEWQRKNLWHPDSPYRKRKGADAVGVSDVVQQDMGKVAQEIEKGLGNDVQREGFRRKAAGELEEVSKQWGGYEAHEREQWQAGEYKGVIGLSVDKASSPDATPESMVRALDMGESAIIARGSAEGWGAKVMEAETQDFREKFHTAAVGRLLGKGDLAGARAHFDGVKEQLGKHATGIEKVLGQAERDGRADKTVSDLLSVSRHEKTGWVDAESAFRQVDAMEGSAELKDEVRARLGKRVHLEQEFEKQQVAEQFKTALSAFVRPGGGLGAIAPGVRSWLIERAPDKWRDLQQYALGEARSVRAANHVDQSEARALRREQDERDAAEGVRYQRMSPEEIAALDVVTEFGGKVSTKKLEALQKDQHKVAASAAKGELPKLVDINGVIKAELGAAMESAKPFERKNKEKAFRDQASQWLSDYRAEHDDKLPTMGEAREGLKKLSGEFVIEGLIFDSKKRGYELTDGEKLKAKTVAAPVAPVAPAPLAVPKSAAQKPPWPERVKQLNAKGIKDPKAIKATLDAEGY